MSTVTMKRDGKRYTLTFADDRAGRECRALVEQMHVTGVKGRRLWVWGDHAHKVQGKVESAGFTVNRGN